MWGLAHDGVTMKFAAWVRAFEAVIGLTEAVRRLRRPAIEESDDHRDVEERLATRTGERLPGALEARLAGVVVAALKEAFDRDSTRLEMERSHVEAERKRAEQMVRLELMRQSAERETSQLRLIAGAATLIWVTSAIVVIRFAGELGIAPRITLGIGWLLILTTFAACAVAYRQLISRVAALQWKPDLVSEDPAIDIKAAMLAPWLLVAGLGVTALSLVLSL
jgi:hypothetical protein